MLRLLGKGLLSSGGLRLLSEATLAKNKRAPTRDGDWTIGDVVVAIDGHPVTCPDDLRALLECHRPGTAVKVQVERAGRRRTVSVTLAEEK